MSEDFLHFFHLPIDFFIVGSLIFAKEKVSIETKQSVALPDSDAHTWLPFSPTGGWLTFDFSEYVYTGFPINNFNLDIINEFIIFIMLEFS